MAKSHPDQDLEEHIEDDVCTFKESSRQNDELQNNEDTKITQTRISHLEDEVAVLRSQQRVNKLVSCAQSQIHSSTEKDEMALRMSQLEKGLAGVRLRQSGHSIISEEDNYETRPDIMLATIEAWKKTDDIYVTKCVQAVKEKISIKDCVCVIGVPGAGKSTALHHAALSLEREGFTIYFISGPNEFDKYYNSSMKQVFVLENVLGVHSISKDKVDAWLEHDEKIRNALGTNTKLLVSIKTQLFMYETIRNKDYVFLDHSSTTDHVDCSDDSYKIGIDEMRGMLKHNMTVKGKNIDEIDDSIRKLWPKNEKDMTEMDADLKQYYMERYNACLQFSEWFPLLCKVFVNTETVIHNPKQFFDNPFSALKNVLQNIKSEDNYQFCALVICTIFDGKLTDDMLSPLCNIPSYGTKNKLDKSSVELRNHIMAAYGLKCPKDLKKLQSALDSLTGIFVSHLGDAYKMSHAVFQNIVTYLYDDPLFVFQHATREFIRDNIRINASPKNDTIVYSDDKNIQRLADRLIRDIRSDVETGAKFICDNPNIGDSRLISCLQRKLLVRGNRYEVGLLSRVRNGLRARMSEKEQMAKRLIDELFEQCMWNIWCKRFTYKHGDVIQYRLIELCVKAAADCNMYISGAGYPLYISAQTGCIQLTKLLLSNGADTRRVVYDGDYSILHWVCSVTVYNKLELIKLLTENDKDKPVVRFLTSDRHQILQDIDRYNDNIQLQEICPGTSVKNVTKDKHEMKNIVKHSRGKLQIVEIVHDHILTYKDMAGRNILHYSADDIHVTKYLLGLPLLQEAIKHRNKEGKTPYWYVKNNLHPYKGNVDVNDEDRKGMMKLYKDNNASG